MEEDYYHFTYLEDQNFQRKKCVTCSSFFWTRDSHRKTCGDTTCDSYSFIGNPPTSRSYSIDEMREAFIGFFTGTHTRVEPYPVVPRWRDDVLLVNASIYDFQPHVTSGVAAPPANPLVLSQPSIRMVDIDNVGKTGRHTTSFEMMCHDAFNTRGKEIYWKNETVEYCNKFLTESLSIPESLITYKEKPWSGGGNGGDALEVFVNGLEVATLVFMDMEQDPEGEYVIDGEKYSKMGNRIIDTGYGLERLVWLTDGKQSIYESLFHEIIQFLRSSTDVKTLNDKEISELSRLSSRMEDSKEPELLKALMEKLKVNEKDESDFRTRYTNYKSLSIVADHTKTILVLLNDKVVPSNVKVGYILRMLIRRALRSLKSLGIKIDLYDLINKQLKNYESICKNFDPEFAKLIIKEETEKNEEVLKTGVNIVSRLIERNRKLTVKDLITLYDSNGIDPETVAEIYMQKTGKQLSIPEDFHSMVIDLHEGTRKKVSKVEYPQFDTRPLYYDDARIREFTGIVLYSKDGKVILNQTAFYPEGGGQPPDHGYLQRGSTKYNVSYVERSGKSVVHHVDGNPAVRTRVRGFIDYDRRWQLMIHHSATHLLLAVTREILGSHVWQTGVQKGIDSSRIDLIHYAKITDVQISEIEKRCLEIIEQDRKITVRNLEWNRALDKYGFTLFQGGVPLEGKIRVVEIDGIDAEGCGGTHLRSTGAIGMLKVVSADSIQDGIQRITFIAGPALLRYTQKLHRTAAELKELYKTDMEGIVSSSTAVLNENISMHKEREKIEKSRMQEVLDRSEEYNIEGQTVRVVKHSLDEDGAKLISKAVTSLKSDLSVIIDMRKHEMSAISKGKLNSEEFLRKVCGNGNVKFISSGKRFSRVLKTVDLNERLIRSALV